MPQKITHILLIAGEASGDLLGAELAESLKELIPNLKITGIGGSKMANAGVDIIFDANLLAVVGIWEVLKNVRKITSALKLIKNYLKRNPPHLLILIDYPGFNLRVAKIAKKANIKVLFYVSPQIWAWRYGRIHKIAKRIDHMAVLFQFEKVIYEKENIPVTFVGHPLSQLIENKQNNLLLYNQYGLNPQKKIIALLPGSRNEEIRRLLPVMIETIPLIQQQLPDTQFIIPVASSLHPELLIPYLKNQAIIVQHSVREILPICDAAIVTSGTATLEVALTATPLMIIYKTSFTTYWLARYLIRIKQMGLCNIVAGKPIAKELIQNDCTAPNIANETLRLLLDEAYRQKQIENCRILQQQLGKHDGSKVAQLALSLI